MCDNLVTFYWKKVSLVLAKTIRVGQWLHFSVSVGALQLSALFSVNKFLILVTLVGALLNPNPSA